MTDNTNIPGDAPRPIPSSPPHGIQYQGMPVGAVVAYAGQIRTNNTTDGHQLNIDMFPWLVCDGRKLEIAKYPELYQALGDLYGKAASGYFVLPDFRGQFLRGVDDRAGVEASGSKEQRKTADGVASTTVGSFQDTAMRSHQHHYLKNAQGVLVPADPPVGEGLASMSESKETFDILGVDTEKVSSFESRPPNVFIHWLIKCSGVQG
ncbi:phage tail protein [Vibrio sp. DNB22_10_4]